jgi:hypothetical protein
VYIRPHIFDAHYQSGGHKVSFSMPTNRVVVELVMQLILQPHQGSAGNAITPVDSKSKSLDSFNVTLNGATFSTYDKRNYNATCSQDCMCPALHEGGYCQDFSYVTACNN